MYLAYVYITNKKDMECGEKSTQHRFQTRVGFYFTWPYFLLYDLRNLLFPVNIQCLYMQI